MSSHYNQARWSKLTLFEQMGNIGSEVGRAFSAKKRADKEAMKSALYRGLDLFDATAEAWSSNQARVREILRAREQFAKSITTDEEDATLENYFMQYAIAARINK